MPVTAHRRLRVMQAATLGVFVLLALQLLRLHIVEAAVYRRVGGDGYLRVLLVEPPRGLIFDRNGVPLARNTPQFTVIAVPADIPTEDGHRLSVLLAIERETGVAYRELERLLAVGLRSVDPLSPVTIRTGLDSDAAIALRAAIAGLPGVRVEAAPVRRYEGGDLLAQVLGYVGPITREEVRDYLDLDYPLDARVGRSGVEISYESELRGRPGRRLIVAGPAGRELELLEELPPDAGSDLVLSIGLDLQAAAARALRDGIEVGLTSVDGSNAGDRGDRAPLIATGAAVVLDVRSGELLAMVSLPSYEANLFSGVPNTEALDALLADRARPLVQRAYMEVRSPGSIFKPLAALAALQEGVATPDTRITSTGAIVVQDEFDPEKQYVFRDWAAHGTLDLYGGIARSSDVYFYYLSGGYVQGGEQLFEGLGAERLATYSRAFGLGRATGLDLPSEAGGLVPNPLWKEGALDQPWVLGDTYNFGIGQGYLTTTPLQMAVAGAAIANGGEVLAPRVVRSLRSNGVTLPTPRTVSDRLPIDAEHLEVVRDAMRIAAAAGGTAARGQPAGLTIGGKTGTAEFGQPHADGSSDTHGWFLGFAPYESPEIAVVVYLRHGTGATHAAPVARTIFEAYFRLGTVAGR